MKPCNGFTFVKLQIALNKRMYEIGKIPYNTYSQANEILNSKLIYSFDDDIINHNKRK